MPLGSFAIIMLREIINVKPFSEAKKKPARLEPFWKLQAFWFAKYLRLKGLILTPGFKSKVKVWLSAIRSQSSESWFLTNAT